MSDNSKHSVKRLLTDRIEYFINKVGMYTDVESVMTRMPNNYWDNYHDIKAFALDKSNRDRQEMCESILNEYHINWKLDDSEMCKELLEYLHSNPTEKMIKQEEDELKRIEKFVNYDFKRYLYNLNDEKRRTFAIEQRLIKTNQSKTLAKNYQFENYVELDEVKSIENYSFDEICDPEKYAECHKALYFACVLNVFYKDTVELEVLLKNGLANDIFEYLNKLYKQCKYGNAFNLILDEIVPDLDEYLDTSYIEFCRNLVDTYVKNGDLLAKHLVKNINYCEYDEIIQARKVYKVAGILSSSNILIGETFSKEEIEENLDVLLPANLLNSVPKYTRFANITSNIKSLTTTSKSTCKLFCNALIDFRLDKGRLNYTDAVADILMNFILHHIFHRDAIPENINDYWRYNFLSSTIFRKNLETFDNKTEEFSGKQPKVLRDELFKAGPILKSKDPNNTNIGILPANMILLDNNDPLFIKCNLGKLFEEFYNFDNEIIEICMNYGNPEAIKQLSNLTKIKGLIDSIPNIPIIYAEDLPDIPDLLEYKHQILG